MRLVIVITVLLSACGSDVSPVPDGGVTEAGAIDGGPSTCPPPVVPVLPAACAPLAELGAPPNAITLRPGGGVAFAIRDLGVRAHPARATCEDGYWEDHGDARVRFTAPAGGRWRFTVEGGGLIQLALAPCGTVPSCTGDLGVRGEVVSSSVVRDVEIPRGDTIEVVIDGCPRGGSCSYDLTVERVADVSCAGSSVAPCPTDAHCEIDPCDPERFACHPNVRPTLTRLDVYGDGVSGYVVGAAEDAGDDRGGLLFARWLDASGDEVGTRDDFHYAEVATDGTEIVELGVPADAVRGRFWFYDGTNIDGAEGRDATVVRWSGGSLGETCAASPFTSHCADGLHCNDARVCEAVLGIQILGAQAYYDARSESLRIEIEGLSPTTLVTSASADLVDEVSAVSSIAGISVSSRYSGASRTEFHLSMVLANPPTRGNVALAPYHVPANVARVRIVLADAEGHESAPVEIEVVATSAGGIGAPCAEPSLGCTAGLVCPESSSLDRAPRCEPPITPLPCGAAPGTPVWSPVGAGMHTFHGPFGSDVGGFLSCLASRVLTPAALELVAPTTGAYHLEARGCVGLEIAHACSTAAPDVACDEVTPGGTGVLDVSMTAGEHALITMLAGRGEQAFDLVLDAP